VGLIRRGQQRIIKLYYRRNKLESVDNQLTSGVSNCLSVLYTMEAPFMLASASDT
jgi:hypothetical protein